VLRKVHPTFRRRQCYNANGNPKAVHPDEAAAWAQVREIERTRKVEAGRLEAYRCRRHEGFHIGKK